jgi:hypothetical protein
MNFTGHRRKNPVQINTKGMVGNHYQLKKNENHIAQHHNTKDRSNYQLKPFLH